MKKILFLLAFTCYAAAAFSQPAPAFWNEILEFKKADAHARPAKVENLFIGSSSFRMWGDLQASFPGADILNRAFGGSTLPDVTRYFYEVVAPYNPSKIFIYCGENDLAESDTVSAQTVTLRFKTLFAMIRTNFPASKLYYVSIKPSPSREKIQLRAKQANRLIRKFLDTQKQARFINIYDEMLDAEGKMREELFLQDRLHMNSKGYEIWARKIRPFIL